MIGSRRNFLLAALCASISLALDAPQAVAETSRAGGTEPSSGKMLITGSSTMAPLVTAIAERFRVLHPGVEIDVQAGGSGRGLADARAGKADIGMVSRALTDKEGDVFGFPIARDGIAIVIHRDNPVPQLSDAQIRAIYLGRITNWKDVGGRNAAIAVIAAEESRSSSELFSHYFNMKYADIKAQTVLGDNPLRLKAIADNPNGIVYMSVGEAERKARIGAPIKLLSIGGVPATSRNIRSGNYPISRALTLVTKQLPKRLAKEFINFSLSAQVTDVIEKHDFIPYMD